MIADTRWQHEGHLRAQEVRNPAELGRLLRVIGDGSLTDHLSNSIQVSVAVPEVRLQMITLRPLIPGLQEHDPMVGSPALYCIDGTT